MRLNGTICYECCYIIWTKLKNKIENVLYEFYKIGVFIFPINSQNNSNEQKWNWTIFSKKIFRIDLLHNSDESQWTMNSEYRLLWKRIWKIDTYNLVQFLKMEILFWKYNYKFWHAIFSHFISNNYIDLIKHFSTFQDNEKRILKCVPKISYAFRHNFFHYSSINKLLRHP